MRFTASTIDGGGVGFHRHLAPETPSRRPVPLQLLAAGNRSAGQRLNSPAAMQADGIEIFTPRISTHNAVCRR